MAERLISALTPLIRALRMRVILHLHVPLRRRSIRLLSILLSHDSMLLFSKLGISAIEERERGLPLHGVLLVRVVGLAMAVRRLAGAAADADDPEERSADAEGHGEPVERELRGAEGELDVVRFEDGVECADYGAEQCGRGDRREDREKCRDGG